MSTMIQGAMDDRGRFPGWTKFGDVGCSQTFKVTEGCGPPVTQADSTNQKVAVAGTYNASVKSNA